MFFQVKMSNLEGDMLELCQALVDFFDYAAAQPGQALDEDAFRQAQPGIADWLLSEFSGAEKGAKALREAVGQLFQQPQTARRRIARAVAHDMGFYQAGNGAGFAFETATMPEAVQDIVHDFFVYFNHVVFNRKDGPQLNGHTSSAARKKLREDYYGVNSGLEGVCPVCLGERRGRKENELDHYFPESRYPVLAVHPWNLIYICKECNQTYKKSVDPLPRRAPTLDKVFRPYRDTVRDHVKLEFQWEPVRKEDRVKLVPAPGCAGDRDKIANFDRLYHLEERWSDSMEHVYETLRQYYTERVQGRVGRRLDKDGVRLRLEEQAQKWQWSAGHGCPDRFLEGEYMTWLSEEQLDAFFKALEPPEQQKP